MRRFHEYTLKAPGKWKGDSYMSTNDSEVVPNRLLCVTKTWSVEVCLAAYVMR